MILFLNTCACNVIKIYIDIIMWGEYEFQLRSTNFRVRRLNIVVETIMLAENKHISSF